MSQTTPTQKPSVNALIALGSNGVSPWGDPRGTVLKAMDQLAKRIGSQMAISRLYATPAFPAGAGPDFVNAAIRLETAKSPAEILAILHAIEAEAARTRTKRWGQRTLDLDLIACGDAVLPDVAGFAKWHGLVPEKQGEIAPDQLILPHPRVQDRAFVLVPLADVAPDWMHPVLGQSVLQMRNARPQDELDGVVVL